MSKGINLNLNEIFSRKVSTRNKGYFWIHLSNMQNCQVALQIKGEKIQRILCQDRAVYEAVDTLKQAKLLLTEHGATEGLMAIFNRDNQLGNAIGVSIPEITSINQRAVGEMCCEGIDQVVESAYAKVCEFFHELAHSVCDYLDKLCETSKCQKETLDGLANDLLGSIETIDAAAFATDEVFGFTQPVFMERINALNAINEAMPSLDAGKLSAIEEPLKTLGYQVEEKVAVVEESPAAAVADAPAPEEVMSAPVADAPQEVAKEDLENAPQREDAQAIPVDGPADAPQEQEMAVFRWTPANLKEAVVALSAVLGKCDNINKARDIVCECKRTVCEAVEQIGEEGSDKEKLDAEIESCRTFASSVSSIAQLYGTACSHMVDQIVAMCGKLKKAEVPEQAPAATPVEEVTEEKPLGDKRKVRKVRRKARNEFEGGDVTEHEFDPEKQTEDPAGTLPDDTEGPVGGDETPSAPTPTNRRRASFNEFEGGDVTEHTFEPEKQTDEPAGTMEDDTEGDGKSGDGDSDPAGALEEGTEGPVEGENVPSASDRRKRRRARNEGAVAPDGTVVEEPIVPPAAPVEPVTPTEEPVAPAAPATPVNPDGSPIEEEPLVPPQPAMTNEAGVEEPEGLPNGEASPEPLDDPAPGVDPNGDPEVPDAVTEPHREVVETPPEDIPGESAEQRINDTRFRFF